ncbi:hypothetical protein [Hymenobacter arizonensis]|uniref:Uncharacterized protein n=1 Tax=Hymenobacter arizonensis TaxID=1227077 RepID=A0A1I6BMY3_HYMAR|nr:hypothetical protein [Hymenobacter arizonensis]SFQ82296.1 hypothetical protein SAMN04515668_4781 [Hymenobacter arizonensis]
MNELQRLTDETQHQAPSPPWMVLTVQGVQDPKRCLASVVEVMQAVLTIPAPLWEEGKEAQWAAVLPEWFVTSMTRYTLPEIMARPEQWHFESWVATMCAREWEWWSSAAGPGWFQISVDLMGLPSNVEPLFYLVHACCEKGYRLTVTEDE